VRGAFFFRLSLVSLENAGAGACNLVCSTSVPFPFPFQVQRQTWGERFFFSLSRQIVVRELSFDYGKRRTQTTTALGIWHLAFGI